MASQFLSATELVVKAVVVDALCCRYDNTSELKNHNCQILCQYQVLLSDEVLERHEVLREFVLQS